MAAPSPDIDAVSRIRFPPRRVIVAAGVLAAIVIGAAGADWLAPYPFDEMHLADRLHGPSFIYLAGTDEYGRDVLSRTLLADGCRCFSAPRRPRSASPRAFPSACWRAIAAASSTSC